MKLHFEKNKLDTYINANRSFACERLFVKNQLAKNVYAMTNNHFFALLFF
jgi:hypothetical protein